MRINSSNRDFRYNGRHYYIHNIRADKNPDEDGYKYNVYEISKDDHYSVLYNEYGWDMLKFKTIKDARRWIHDWDFCSKPWD